MRLRPYLLATGLILSVSAPALAATYYVAPRDARPCAAQSGTQSCPFSTPGAALSKAKGGDTILLMDGDYDGLEIRNRNFDSPVTIMSLNGKKARLEYIKLVRTDSNISFKNLSVWPDDPAGGAGTRIDTDFATNLAFDGLDVRSGKDAATYANWSAEEWAARRSKGFQSRGANVTLQNSTFTGVSFGIVLMGDNSKAISNKVMGFSGDGMRALGANNVIEGNFVTDCVRIDANHPDGLQSWSQNGVPVKNMRIEGNVIIEWSNPIQNPNRCRLQGIGFFDGFYDDIIIRNNVISTTAYHGISIYGGRNVEIVNNTVVNGKGEKQSYPWIGIFKKKSGTPSSDVTLANNLAMKYTGTSDAKNNVLSVSSSVITYPAKVFTDVSKYNYIPKTDSGFIDNGDKTIAPPVDLRNYKRPAGKGPDRGAYETGSALVSGSNTTAAMALTK